MNSIIDALRAIWLLIMWRKDINYAISEISLDVKTDRIMIVRLDSPDKVSVIIVNVYMPSTDMSMIDYRDVVDVLQVVYDTYANQCTVLLCGDLNAQLGSQSGPRGNDPQSIRGKCLFGFIVRNNLCSIITQDHCMGPKCTFWPSDTTGDRQPIDHFIISPTYMSIVDKCYVSDDHSSNTSDYVPVNVHITVDINRYQPQHRPMYIYNWSKCCSI